MKGPIIALLLALNFCAALFAQTDPNKVYLVVNKNDPDSAKIAELYCNLRGVPQKNIIEINTNPKAGLVGRKYYFENVETPIVAGLVKLGAINATDLDATEDSGRRKYAYLSHDVDFIILCKGVPWGINPEKGEGSQTVPTQSTARSSAAAVDSELAAVFLPQKTFKGQIKNPLYNNFADRKLYAAYGVLRVARLDGATYEDVENSLKKTMYAEENGLRGRAYIDKSQKVKSGDMWLEGAAKILRDNLYYDTDVDENRAVFGYEDRFDGAAFYFGWYAGSPTAFFKIDGFTVAPGSVGLHIYSFSARNMRSANSWTPNLVRRGMSFTVGNVYEPFLSPTHDPEKIMRALASGICAGEAAYASVPVLSWQSLFVGDPLYQPFKVSLQKQIDDIDSGKIDAYSQYAIIRRMNQMSAEGVADAAKALAEKWVGKMPDSALLWKLLQLAQINGDKFAAAKYADALFARDLTADPDFYGLAMALAKYLAAQDKASAEKAIYIYTVLLGKANIPEAFERVLVSRATAAAKKYSLNISDVFAQKSAEHAEKDRLAAQEKAEKEAAKKK